MNARGFTLLELLLVILITGILAVVVAPIINEPIRAYFDQTTRANLVDAAEMALRRMARDARQSLPYSVRVNPAQTAFEFVSIADVARYRNSAAGGAGQFGRLRTDQADTDFGVIGTFGSYGAGTLVGDERLVIFNLGSGDNNIYEGDAVVTPAGTVVDISVNGTEHHVNMNPGHQFADQSPSRRVYIADGAVSYACSGGGLYRHSGYGYLLSQPSPATVAGGVLMTDKVTNCSFAYDPGNSRRPGLLSMSLTLTDNGESITLLHQVHIPNAT